MLIVYASSCVFFALDFDSGLLFPVTTEGNTDGSGPEDRKDATRPKQRSPQLTQRQLLAERSSIMGLKRRNDRRRHLLMSGEKPRSTINDIVGAVSVFERWFLARCPGDQREMYEIPPVELDRYLVEYFTTVTSRHGQDYSPESYSAHRSRLDSYLKDWNYPHSITSSSIFAQSQAAFRLRKAKLVGRKMQKLSTNQNTGSG